MPIEKNFILKEVAGEFMIIPLQGGNMNMGKVFNTNEVGAFIYKALKENDNPEAVAEAITKEYAVDYETALKDTKEFIEELKRRGIYA